MLWCMRARHLPGGGGWRDGFYPRLEAALREKGGAGGAAGAADGDGVAGAEDQQQRCRW